MLGYLKKFNNLPAVLRQKVSNQAAMAAIEKLEQKYQLPLAALIMKVMVKEIALAEVALYLRRENLVEAAAGQLAEELNEKIFFSLRDYLSPTAYPSARPADSSRAAIKAGTPARFAETSARQAARTEPAVRPKPSSVSLPKPSPSNAPNPQAVIAGLSGQPLAKGANFFFSTDDEQEIRELAKKIDLAEKTAWPAAQLEQKLNTIINRAQINFGSADLADRFKRIFKTYLRGIRNELETKLALKKPFASGGLSFDEDSARKVMTLANKIASPVKSGVAGFPPRTEAGQPRARDGRSGQTGETAWLSSKARIQESNNYQETESTAVRDAPYDFSKLTQKKKISTVEAAADEESLVNLPVGQAIRRVMPGRQIESDRPGVKEPKLELAPLTPAVAASDNQPAVFQPKEKIPFPAKAENKVSASAKRGEEAGETSQMPLIRRRFEAENLDQSPRVKVEDVKYVPRVMSPLDEIRFMDLVNFRRLDKDPFRAVEKIKSKMNLLEEENYGKRLEGIKFWRISPLNKLYLDIGHSSISENKPVDVIIEERKIKARDYLTASEFKAMVDLNKSLRF